MAGPAHFLALVALLPAAASPGLLAQAEGIALSLCGGSGTVSIPLDSPLPGTDGSACCNKGCHSNDKRKRMKGLIDRAQ